MKERLIVVLLVTIFLSTTLISQPVSAQDDQLEWGVQVGDEFSYVLQRKTMNPQIAVPFPEWLRFVQIIDEGHQFDLIVESLETIPDSPDASEPGPFSYSTLTRNNDSTLISINSTAFILPTGNWDFHTTRLNLDQHPEILLIDNNDEWGTVESDIFSSENILVNYHVEFRFDKETGALSYVRLKYDTSRTVLVDIIFAKWYEGIPTVIPPDFDVSGILIIAIAVSVGVIVAICVYKSYSGKKPLVQRLGE
ncbi:MAG: hypothetical protein ACTSUO_03630 [Candidatus Thorarchaeota archaeon]